MGHRCNYAKRENGEVTLYYSHWGALTRPSAARYWTRARITVTKIDDRHAGSVA